jgi:hypothetical protein
MEELLEVFGIVGLASIGLDQLFKIGVWNVMLTFFLPVISALSISDDIFSLFQSSYLAASFFMIALLLLLMVLFWAFLAYLLQLVLITKMQIPLVSTDQKRKRILGALLVINILVFSFHLLQSLVPSFNVR